MHDEDLLAQIQACFPAGELLPVREKVLKTLGELALPPEHPAHRLIRQRFADMIHSCPCRHTASYYKDLALSLALDIPEPQISKFFSNSALPSVLPQEDGEELERGEIGKLHAKEF